MFILMHLAEYIIHTKNIFMIKSLFIFALAFNSCASGNSKVEQKQDNVQHIKSEQSQTSLTSKKETVDSNFLLFWEEFIVAAKSKNQKTFIMMSFDSLECEGKNVHINTFIKSNFSKVFDESFFSILSDTSRVEFINSEIDVSSLPKPILKEIKKGKCIERIVNITTVNKYPAVIITLKFIETKKGFKFYEYDKFG